MSFLLPSKGFGSKYRGRKTALAISVGMAAVNRRTGLLLTHDGAG